MATFGYARVSTDTQAEDGQSLGVQQRQIKGYALMLGLSLTETFIELGVSGAVPFHERPEGKRLLAGLQPGDSVITAKLDRAFRSADDALAVLRRLKEQQVSLHMIDLGGDVTGNGISKLVFTILSAVAENERDRIRERVADVKRDQRHRGRFLGGRAPWGWRVDEAGKLVAVPKQQAAIARMKELRTEGLSTRRIAAVMAAEGHQVTPPTVLRVVRETAAERRAP